MTVSEADARAEGRREAAPAALITLLGYVALASVSWVEGWDLVGLPWWVWLLVALPVLLLTVDLAMSFRGFGLVRSREAALALLGLLVLGNVAALVILVAGLVTTKASDLGGGELLLTGFAIWELDAGGPASRSSAGTRTGTDFRFPQDPDSQQDGKVWGPQVWDYVYVSLTNSIAFSPTDTMPLTLRAKAMMGAESAISAITILLVAARAVNILGS